MPVAGLTLIDLVLVAILVAGVPVVFVTVTVAVVPIVLFGVRVD